MVVDAEHGTIDSPLHPVQVQIIPGIPEALAALTAAGYGLSIVTNQPAMAKGKTTQRNLEETHQLILEKVQGQGGIILSSHMCCHTAAEGCSCRKPKTGLLEAAFLRNPGYEQEKSWMVGDGITDIQAGFAYHLKTAYLGARKGDALTLFEEIGVQPDRWFTSLSDFTADILMKG